jgi:hypothetical protein
LPTIERNGLEFLFLFKSTNKLTSSSTPLTISYSGSPYTFTQSIPINTITPTTSGSIISCSATPSLPAGLSLDNASCAISGTPTTIQAATIYAITASNISTSASTNISITVSANAPANLVYAGSPFSFSQNIAITNETPTITGTPSSCSSSPTLPAGLILSSSCVLSGTPTTIQSTTTYTITASNSFGSTSATISIAINSGLFQFSFAAGSLVETGGSGLTLAAVGAPTLANGKDGDTNGSYKFDGSSQYLSIANPAGLPTTSSSRTYCAWVNPTANPNNSVILSQGTASTDNAMGLTLNATYPSTDVSFWSLGTTVSATYTPKINTWQHICGMLSGTTASIYVDGKQIGTGTLPTVNTTLALFNVGANVNFSNKFTGKIDDVRIYNYALTATQIRQIAVQVPTNLLARYDFNGNPADASGNGNSLTSSGTPALTKDRNGTATSAYTLNGATKFLTSTPVTTSVAGNVTLSAWFRPTTFNAGLNYIVVNGTGSDGYGILIDAGAGNVLKGILGGVAYISSTVAPPLNVWSHISLRATGTNWDLRLNGVSIALLASTTPVTPTTGTYIGSDANTGYFTGDIDDVRIYNAALTDAEISTLSGYHPMQVSTWTTTPASSSLKIHFQADSLSNLPNGNPVANWNDNSGNANHVGGGISPTYSAAGLNSKPTVSFVSASNQYLTKVGSTGLSGSNYSIFSVFNPTLVATTSMGILSIASGCNSYDKEQMLVWIGPDHIAEAGICNNLSVPGSSDPIVSGKSYIDSFTYQISSTANLYLNGKTVASVATNATGFSSTDYNIAVGQRMAQGAATAFNGSISEVIYFDGALSNANRITMECYLSSKYNIPLDPAVSCP